MNDIKKKPGMFIADDNPNNLKVLGETLINFGYDVRVAPNGRPAIERAQAPPADLILFASQTACQYGTRNNRKPVVAKQASCPLKWLEE